MGTDIRSGRKFIEYADRLLASPGGKQSITMATDMLREALAALNEPNRPATSVGAAKLKASPKRKWTVAQRAEQAKRARAMWAKREKGK